MASLRSRRYYDVRGYIVHSSFQKLFKLKYLFTDYMLLIVWIFWLSYWCTNRGRLLHSYWCWEIKQTLVIEKKVQTAESHIAMTEGLGDDIFPWLSCMVIFKTICKFYSLQLQFLFLGGPLIQTSKLADKHKTCVSPGISNVSIGWKAYTLHTAHPPFQVQDQHSFYSWYKRLDVIFYL